MQPELDLNESSAADTPEQSGRVADFYPFTLDAVVLAGTHQNPKRLITGRNKAFLKVGDQVLLRYVVDALVDAKSIDQIFVVGPVEDLLEVLAGYPSSVHVIAQRGKMMANCWAGIEASEDKHRYDPLMPVHERPLLVISCDLPLVTARSIDDFVSRCASVDNASAVSNAMLVGVVDEPSVRPFHPSGDKPGIERPFAELAWGRLRLANIYVGRPRKLSHQELLQTDSLIERPRTGVTLWAWLLPFLKARVAGRLPGCQYVCNSP